MSLSSDGSSEITKGMLQERLEKGISPESRSTIEKILANISRLSNVEKLLLYLKLPTHVPVVNSTTENSSSFNNTETVAVTWMKSHLTRNTDTSLLRQKVYDDYKSFCEAHQYDYVSISDFKKILLSVFPGLTTRRLGSRGNAKHMFGGISYLTQPNPLRIPKLSVEPDEDDLCDDAVDYNEGADDSNLGGGNEEERRWNSSVSRAASKLVLEWAYKLLNIKFQSVRELAEHLLSQNYVSQVSLEAFSLDAATNCELLCKDSVEETSVDDSNQKQLNMRQLQRKLQERREISRQKQRMEEERSQLTNQESMSGVSSKQVALSLATSLRNPTSFTAAARAAGTKFGTEVERNLRKVPVPTILPKTLLPKLTVAAPPTLPPVFGIDTDHRAAQRVDLPQVFLLPQNISHLQPCAPSPLVLISNTSALLIPTTEAKMPLQGIQNISIAQLPTSTQLPRRQDLSQAAASDLKVVSVGMNLPPEGGSTNHTSSVQQNKTSESLEAIYRQVQPDGSQKSVFTSPVGSNENCGQQNCVAEVQIVPVCQGSQLMMSPVLTRNSMISFQGLPLKSFTSDSTAEAKELSQNFLGLEPNCGIYLEHSNSVKTEDRCFGSALVEDTDVQTSNSPNMVKPEHQGSVMSSQRSVLRSLASLSQNMKARGRGLPSRSATKTVSSILDEQRCNGPGGNQALKFYNDSRSVSQILKELREKNIPGEFCESEHGTGAITLSELDRTGSTNPFVCNPVMGLTPQTFQIVKLVSHADVQPTDSIILNVQSAPSLQLQGVQSSTSVQFQVPQSAAGSQVKGMGEDGNMQSPAKVQKPNLFPDLLFSKPILQIVHGTELVTSPLLVSSPKTPKAKNTPVFELQQHNFGLTNAIVSPIVTTVTKTEATMVSLPKLTASNCEEQLETRLELEAINRCTVTTAFSSSELRTACCSGNHLIGPKGVSKVCLHPSVLSGEHSKSILQSNYRNLQQLLLKPIQSKTSTAPCLSKVSSATFLTSSKSNASLMEANSISHVWNNTAQGASSCSQARSSTKRAATVEHYGGIKRLLIGDDEPKEFTDAFLMDQDTYEYFNDGKNEAAASKMLTHAHSPGELLDKQEMPYKNNFVQHCTLQQLSVASSFRQQQMQLRQLLEQQSKMDMSTPYGSRPVSAFGDEKSGFSFSLQGTQPSRPNTVAAVLDDHSLDIHTDTFPPYIESAQGPSVESCSSKTSTPISLQSPRSNLSGCSLYMDQANAFMPIHIIEPLPAVSAIKPLPKLGQRYRSNTEANEFGAAAREEPKATVTFTTAAGSFVPYTSLESSRSDGRSGNFPQNASVSFASVSSIRPVKKSGQVYSRQRHHSAHDVQDSGTKLPQGIQAACEITNLRSCSPCGANPLCSEAYLPVSCTLEPSSLSTVTSMSSDLLPVPSVSVLDFRDMETAGEVDEIISTCQDSLVGGSLTMLHRSQSEPANGLQAGSPFDLDDLFRTMLNSDGEMGAAADALCPQKSDVDWNDCAATNRVHPTSEKTENLENNMKKNDKHLWSGATRGDHLISGIAISPSSFANSLHCSDLNSSEFISYVNCVLPSGFIGPDCSPPESQDPTPLFDKPDKDLDAFHPDDGAQPTTLDTPSSLVGIFSTICGDDGEGTNQATNCNMDFGWSYFQS